MINVVSGWHKGNSYMDEVSNVWIFHLMFGRHMLDLHIVQTDIATSAVNMKAMAAG